MLRASQKQQKQEVLPAYRETPMTQYEPRYYKEVYRTNKNVAHTVSTVNPITHDAPLPATHPRAEAKQTARMMKSCVQMFPTQKDKDTFSAPSKRSIATSNQF